MKQKMTAVPQKPPNSFDVAKKAGVSQSTVSLVINGKATGRVSKGTIEKVLRVAEEYGYYRNAAARNLRLGRAHTLALVIPDITNPFFASVLRGAEQIARGHNYTLMLVETGNDPSWQQVILDTVGSRLVDGFVLCAVDQPEELTLKKYSGKYVVAELESSIVPSVQIDSEEGARKAVEYLVSLGHTKIGHLAANLSKATFANRQKAYLSVLNEHSIKYKHDYEEKTGISVDEAKMASQSILTLPDPPTALFCDDDLIAAGVYKTARSLGIQIPRDLSVVGFDDTEIARILEPELTTVSVPTVSLGSTAIEILLKLLIDKELSEPQKIPLELVIRGSTASTK